MLIRHLTTRGFFIGVFRYFGCLAAVKRCWFNFIWKGYGNSSTFPDVNKTLREKLTETERGREKERKF